MSERPLDHDGRILEAVIIGAGIAGIGMAMRLKSAGVESFLVLEGKGELGGTWRDNVYPGVACDVPAPLYSYESMPDGPWSRLFASGGEVLAYLRACAERSGVIPHLRLSTEAFRMGWSEQDGAWRIEHTSGVLFAQNLILACGRLTEPDIPAVPGIETFPGPVLHSARWQGTDFADSRVALVGTGASGVQLLPRLVEAAGSVVVFQRTPAYVLPRNDRPLTETERRALRDGGAAVQRLRAGFFEQAESVHPQRLGVGDVQQRDALRHLSESIPSVALRERLTPGYPLGCKRVTFSDEYYPCFLDPAVTLEPSALAEVRGRTLRSVEGRDHEVDALVLATGFETTDQPFAERVLGRGGRGLAAHWRDRMRSYASTAVHGFPNMFVLNGPNAGLSHNSAVFMIESQIAFVMQALAHQRRNGLQSIEVRECAEQAYLREIDERAAQGVWLAEFCNSWYLHKRTGALNLLWPGTAAAFRREYGEFRADAFSETAITPALTGGRRCGPPSALCIVG